MKACISAGGASMKLLPMRAARRASAGPASAIRSSSARAAARSGGRRRLPLRARDQRLERDEAPDAVGVRRRPACGPSSRASRLLRPGERQPGERRAAHVVGDVAHRAFEVGRDPRRARARPAGRAHAPPPRAAPRCAGRAPRPAGGCPPRPRRAARRCRPPPPSRADASAPCSIASKVGSTSRAPAAGAARQEAHRLGAHASASDRRRRRARSRARSPLPAPAARTASRRTASSPSRAACRSRPHRPAFAAAETISCARRRRPARAPPSSARSASRVALAAPACRRPSRTRARRSSAPADRCRRSA